MLSPDGCVVGADVGGFVSPTKVGKEVKGILVGTEVGIDVGIVLGRTEGCDEG